MKVIASRILFLIYLLVYSIPATQAQSNAKQASAFPQPVLKPGLYSDQNRLWPTTAVEKFLQAMERRIYANWESPRNCPQMKFVVHFLVDNNGQFSEIRLRNPSTDCQCNFAAIEAVYESSKFCNFIPPDVRECEISLEPSKKTNCKDCTSLIATNENLMEGYVVWHLIPLEALQCIPGMSSKVVHSKANLRWVKVSKTDSQDLESARREWSNFLHSDKNLKQRDVEKFASYIDKKLSRVY